MILTGKVTLKKLFFVSALTLGVVLADMNINQLDSKSNELRFLGWGRKTTYTDCFMGHRFKIREYTVFWITLGEASYDSESC